jgi:hypothetical protein
MKRHLHITVDTNRVTCGKCENRSQPAYGEYACEIFGGVRLRHKGTQSLRCAPCLAAEREASK